MSDRQAAPASKTLQRMRLLDQCVDTLDAVRQLQSILSKIERCCAAAAKGHSLADVLNDPSNKASLAKAFGGEQEARVGLQLILKVSLADFECQSVTLENAIEGHKKFDFLHKSLGGWKQFNTVIAFQTFESGSKAPDRVLLVNPAMRQDWQEIGALPSGTLVTAYVRSVGSAKRQRSQEALALDRIIAAIRVVQNPRADLGTEEAAAPAAPAPKPRVNAKPASRPSLKPLGGKALYPTPRPALRPSIASASKASASGGVRTIAKIGKVGGPAIDTSGEPVQVLRIVINKMDTFVHAGNAHLITGHLHGYAGKVMMYVLRPEKQRVQMDADSIWSAEIRNGETVLFEFFGPKPDDAFVKELAKKTNKYTQMDKVANE